MPPRGRAYTAAARRGAGDGARKEPMRDRRGNIRGGLIAVALLFCGGCGVERTLQIESDPPGALVTLNGNEVGRTPTRKEFVWYGTYDVQLRRRGTRR